MAGGECRWIRFAKWDTDQLASTNCAPGYACACVYTDTRQCLATCDFMAAAPGCPTGTVCGVYGLCIEQSVMEPIGYLFARARSECGEGEELGYSSYPLANGGSDNTSPGGAIPTDFEPGGNCPGTQSCAVSADSALCEGVSTP